MRFQTPFLKFLSLRANKFCNPRKIRPGPAPYTLPLPARSFSACLLRLFPPCVLCNYAPDLEILQGNFNMPSCGLRRTFCRLPPVLPACFICPCKGPAEAFAGALKTLRQGRNDAGKKTTYWLDMLKLHTSFIRVSQEGASCEHSIV